MYNAGLAYVFSPAAKVLVHGPENEDAFYAAYGRRTMPAWIVRLGAVLARQLQRRSRESAATTTQMA